MIVQKIIKAGSYEVCVDMMLNPQNPYAVVILPGFNLSKSGPYFLLSKIARACAAKGLNVFQFDYYGDGDSSGDYVDTSLDHVLHTVQMVKNFAADCGCKSFIWLGFGAGNVIAATLAGRSDTAGIGLIAPDFLAHRAFDEIWAAVQKNEELCIYQGEYLWPYVPDASKLAYWSSIIGIVPWMYHTPFNSNLLRQLGDLDMVEALSTYLKELLLLSPNQPPRSILQNPSCQVVELPDLHTRTKQEWEQFDKWPKLWDDIAGAIGNWAGRWGGELAEVQATISDALTYQYDRQGATSRVSASFQSNGQTLTGLLHLPADSPKPAPCVIYEPGLGGSRVDMGRGGPWLGDELAQMGYALLRYDSAGSGVSDGEFYQVTLERRYQNLCSAIAYLQQLSIVDASKLYIVSYSAGAKVACLAVDRIPSIKACVMWSPHFIDHAEENRRSKPVLFDGEHLAVPMMGLWLGYAFIREEKQFDFARMFTKAGKPVLVITGSDQDQDPNIPLMLKWCERDTHKEIIQYPGAHCFLYRYMESIIRDTVTYMNDMESEA